MSTYSERQATLLATHPHILEWPCPRCGNIKLLCYLMTDEHNAHQHTHYVCTYYGKGRRAACGWHGWFVPLPYDRDNPIDRLGNNSGN